MIDEMIKKINYLAKKSREEGLTEEEKAEQQNLRRQYIDYIKNQVRQQLDNIKFVDETSDSCSCGHHHHHHGGSCGCKKH